MRSSPAPFSRSAGRSPAQHERRAARRHGGSSCARCCASSPFAPWRQRRRASSRGTSQPPRASRPRGVRQSRNRCPRQKAPIRRGVVSRSANASLLLFALLFGYWCLVSGEHCLRYALALRPHCDRIPKALHPCSTGHSHWRGPCPAWPGSARSLRRRACCASRQPPARRTRPAPPLPLRSLPGSGRRPGALLDEPRPEAALPAGSTGAAGASRSRPPTATGGPSLLRSRRCGARSSSWLRRLAERRPSGW